MDGESSHSQNSNVLKMLREGFFFKNKNVNDIYARSELKEQKKSFISFHISRLFRTKANGIERQEIVGKSRCPYFG